MNLHEIYLQQEFPVKANRIFFDHAKVSPLPRSVRDAVNAFTQDACEYGTKNYKKWMAEVERVLERGARMVHLRPGPQGGRSPADPFYDPFWARCIELGVSPAAHSGAFGWDGRRSISNYMYNHMGHFAAAGEALCKALFLGGVTRRFPSLRGAFLEGGVSWAARLLTDLVGHWEKRNSKDLENYNPAHFDRALFGELLERHGGVLREMTAGPDIHELGFGAPQGQAEPDDEFGACGIRCPEDIRDRFVPNFHFGCEADDPLAHHAWDERGLPCQAKLSALFGSDIGHWDVPDMRKVLAEAWEQVEEGRMDAAQFRAFSFENVARFYTDSNPDFFAGTAVESEVQALLSSS